MAEQCNDCQFLANGVCGLYKKMQLYRDQNGTITPADHCNLTYKLREPSPFYPMPYSDEVASPVNEYLHKAFDEYQSAARKRKEELSQYIPKLYSQDYRIKYWNNYIKRIEENHVDGGFQFLTDNDHGQLICYPYSIESLHTMAMLLNIPENYFRKDHYKIPAHRNYELMQRCSVIPFTCIVMIKRGVREVIVPSHPPIMIEHEDVIQNDQPFHFMPPPHTNDEPHKAMISDFVNKVFKLSNHPIGKDFNIRKV